MRERYSGLYHYEDQSTVHLGRFNEQHPVPSVCHLRLLQDGEHAIVIVTELPNNPGRSVTNAATELATKIVADFALDPALTTFVEHYTHGSYRQSDSREPWETYDAIIFTWQGMQATQPEWRRLQPGEPEALLIIRSEAEKGGRA
jgi:hypothetical protein